MTEDVLVEGPSKKDATVWSGRSRHNKLVHFAPHSDVTLRSGDRVDVRIYAAAPHYLKGAFVARTKPAPRRRVRIPVEVV
jgi:tRNA-2-methylthio-N6-dimethylallyladenosine synthase